jgi:hypothetical protein
MVQDRFAQARDDRGGGFGLSAQNGSGQLHDLHGDRRGDEPALMAQ